MKPYYRKGGITIYHGNCREIVPTLPKVELLLADPPYGIDFDTDYRRFSREGIVKPGTNHARVRGDKTAFDPEPWLHFPKVILWGANCFSDKLPKGRWLVWDKRFANGKAFLTQAETAWMNSGHSVQLYSETSQGFIRSEPVQHPTQKPVGLMEWCIEKSRTTGLILDPYLGSGTTLVAAKNLKRQAIGIEIEERYCEIAARRLDGQRALAKAA